MDTALVDEAKRLGSATLHEAAGQIGALPSVIRPMAPELRLAGTAFPVSTAPGNNVWLHRAIASASRGDVLVAVVGGLHEAGYWGEIMTVGAMARGIRGLVIDGSVRDVEPIAALAFPMFARGPCIRGTKKDPDAPGALGEPVTIGNVSIEMGDLVVGDADGVVAIPGAIAGEVIEKGREREKKEAEVMERLRKGETTLDVYRFK
jgi:4-hydroxy-4-methyl-2-oxoglutarate aldolase